MWMPHHALGLTHILFLALMPVSLRELTATSQAIETPVEERKGARVSDETRTSMHKAIGHALRSAKAMMDTCGCENCAKGSSAIDPDNDGDVDWLCLDDTDNDADDQGAMEERVQQILERSLHPVYQRQQTFLARLAQFDTNYAAIERQFAEIQAFKEQLSALSEIKATLERMANVTTLDEVRASLETVKGRVEQIANTPMPGGPVLNGARPPYDKSNPYQPQAPTQLTREQIERETLQRLNAQGAFQNQEDQIAAAALLLRPMQGLR